MSISLIGRKSARPGEARQTFSPLEEAEVQAIWERLEKR
jgi:hypothetical protein